MDNFMEIVSILERVHSTLQIAFDRIDILDRKLIILSEKITRLEERDGNNG